MKTSHVAIPFQGMDLRELEGARLVSNMQPDRWGGLVNRPPLLQVSVTSWPSFGGSDAILLPIYTDDGSPWLALATSDAAEWRDVATSGLDPDAPVAITGTYGTARGTSGIQQSYANFDGRTYFGGGSTLVRAAYSGGTFNVNTSSVPILPKYVGVLPWEARLVIAAGDRVQFSNLEDGTTWGTDNYVDVGLGDGEEIAGVVSWANYLFVFKQTRFFVFYGTSTDADGEPIFNYRTVNSPGATAGVSGAGGAVAAGERGVYHCTPQGELRLSTGGPSRALDPPCPSTRHRHLVFHGGRLHALAPAVSGMASGTAPHESSGIVYVYEEAQRAWTQWQAPGAVQRLVPAGRGALFALVKDSTYTSLRWIAPDYNVDQVGATEYELLPLENGAAGEYITGGMAFGAPGVERSMLSAGLVLDPNLTVDSAHPESSLYASARGQDDARVPDWTADSETGVAPYVRCTGGLGTRHWLYAQTETAARWVGLHATVTEPTGDRDYRDGDVS